jgi:methylphosphotriester-DNA--protein-cysteine methyltransferase
MHTDVRHPIPARLHALAAMSRLIERLEHEPLQASAEQYRGVVRQITRLLEQAEPDAQLDALLRASPATAEIYENLRYAQAGLCRAPLELALNAELAAGAAIRRACAA